MNRWKLALGAVAILTAGFAVAATSMEEPGRLTPESNPPAGSNAAFWCSLWCEDHWVRVKECYEPQTCCGFAWCSLNTGVGICCHPGFTCNYDLGVDPPALPACRRDPPK